MRILHVIANLAPHIGGPVQACRGMATAVAGLGHEVCVYTTDWDGDGRLQVPLDRPLREGGVTYRYFPCRSVRGWTYSRPMKRALDETVGDFDLVHLHSLYLFHTWAAAAACIRNRVPYLLRPHGTLDPYIRARGRLKKRIAGWLFQDRVIRRAAALHFTSEDEMRLAAPASFGRPGVVVPNGVVCADYADLPPPGRLRVAHPEIGERRIVLFLGRLAEKKGLDILVPAFAAAARQHDDLHLVLAGPDDGMRAAVESWLAAHDIAERASFTGMLRGDDKLAAFADAELFVLPSYSENFGIAVVEAMACGCPVLISDRVNIWREIEADGGGYVCAPEVPALSETLAGALADGAELRRRGIAARESARRRYDWQVVAPQLEAAYARLSGEARRTA